MTEVAPMQACRHKCNAEYSMVCEHRGIDRMQYRWTLSWGRYLSQFKDAKRRCSVAFTVIAMASKTGRTRREVRLLLL
eukprot:8214737-Pyramimonas_sp.AAC.2